jgi:malonate-semialdehyde dehydrogenase (acetylating) / methylmalonate-semialdehyde dehydrogenase
MTEVVPHWRAGERWEGSGERFGDVHDPATGRVARQVAFASGADVDAVVADAAAREWGAMSLARRTAVVLFELWAEAGLGARVSCATLSSQ